jgi:hypothetical protein
MKVRTILDIFFFNCKDCWEFNGEVYWMQYYVIKFVSDLQQVGGFLQELQFPPPIKLTATM